MFKQSANRIIPISLETLTDHRIEKLGKITAEKGASSFTFTGKNLIPQIYKKFKISISSNNISFDIRELRTLSFTLSHSEHNLDSIFSDEDELNYALLLLDSNWRNRFLVGLIDCYLKNWETKNRKSLEILEKFGANKLENYKGNRTSLIGFKNNNRFFNSKNGDLVLGDTLAKLNKPIKDATKYLSVPESWFVYPYFSKVITTYYERNKNNLINKIDDLNEILQQHKNYITNKRLISKIIIHVNQPQFLGLQDKVKSIAFKIIGDPSTIKWNAFENVEESEKKEIAEARHILEEWIAKQFIDIFFKVCINDERRKKFWLKIASQNKLTFKVYGPTSTKRILQRDKRIEEYLETRFETVYSRKDVSAFILYIGDYMLIEFSDAGYAFYGYKINGNNKPSLNYKLNSVDDLRNGNLPMLVYRSGYSIENTNSEGRLSHIDGDLGWEQVFEYWFENIAGINV